MAIASDIKIFTIAIIGIAVLTSYLSYTISIFAQPSQNIIILPGASSPTSQRFYDPPQKEITRGTQVKWTNNDRVLHTVISAVNSTGDQFNSGLIAPSNTFSHTFRVSGHFAYYCSIYPWMTGRLVVN